MYIKRLILKDLCNDIFQRHINILIGARQVGKSFLMRQVEEEAKRARLKTAYFDLEQPQDLSKLTGSDGYVIKVLGESGDVVFLDEFHYLENSSKLLKAIYDSGKKVKLYASGSSSLEIHKHLKESLAGRKLLNYIFPCALREIGQVMIHETFSYYCQYGGMPGIIHAADADKRKMLLADIAQSYLLKDVKSLIREENIRAFNHLLYLLAQYQGSVVPTSNFAREVGMTAKTIEAYLEIMAQTFVCFPLASFSKNYGNELKKSKKYFLYDLGIRNALLRNFAPWEQRNDAGAIIESFVFGELQKQLSPETEIRFWRLKDGTEVDFIWIKNQTPYPIEVKASVKIGDIPKGLTAFLKKYPLTQKAFVVSKNTQGQITFNNIRIIYKKCEEAFSIPEEV